MLEANDKGTKALKTSCSVKLVPNAKCNADNQLSLKKKKKSGNNCILSELESLSLLQSEQISKDENFKLRQLSIEECKFSIEECKFQAESEWKECKLGMLEQELNWKAKGRDRKGVVACWQREVAYGPS